MTFGPVVPSHGPPTAPIMFIGEAPGSEESEKGLPFVGPSGQELRRMCRTVGLDLSSTYRANVFSRQPKDNNLALYGTVDPSPFSRSLGPLTLNPILYVDDSHLGELERLRTEIESVGANIIVALGNTASWMLGLGQGISKLRGSLYPVTFPGASRPYKVLPTFHPSAVLRQWDLRVTAIADLQKAVNESHSPDLRFDNSELWLNPDLNDLVRFDLDYMSQATICAADIETRRGQITHVSFAPSPSVSLCVPFWQKGPVPNYWSTVEAERAAWGFVRKWMEREDLVKVGQNFLFDLQYLSAHCNPRACVEDTMLAHHSLYSELPKGLGYLASIYANYPRWKNLRTFKKEEQLKRDD